ncbi:MAG TPA: DUF6265 family protein [Acidobacteriota bacterium]|nr:DUF6265 family protein [Acidobacteriota bacterium]
MRKLLLSICFLSYALFGNAETTETSLKDLSWIAGHWGGELWGGNLEEIWTAPEGDCMMGMFRFVKEGRVQLYEFLTIENELQGPVLKLKHFNRGLKGWEEKEETIQFPLISATSNEAVFQRVEKEKPAKMIFRRKDDQTLVVTLERDQEGKTVSEDFVYKRK